MPKDTFLNLSAPKKEKMDMILLDTFYNQSVSQVKVSRIVEQMDMSRGAFYKYFVDLEDAYAYIVKKQSLLIHQDILDYIAEHKNNFFHGIEQYLVWCSNLSTESPYWKGLLLLTRADYQRTMKRLDLDESSYMLREWINLLENNHFSIHETQEAVSFLYFIMEVVMSSLTDFVVNDWTPEELLMDYHYKIKWITHGITQEGT